VDAAEAACEGLGGGVERFMAAQLLRDLVHEGAIAEQVVAGVRDLENGDEGAGGDGGGVGEGTRRVEGGSGQGGSRRRGRPSRELLVGSLEVGRLVLELEALLAAADAGEVEARAAGACGLCLVALRKGGGYVRRRRRWVKMLGRDLPFSFASGTLRTRGTRVRRASSREREGELDGGRARLWC